MLVKSIIFSRHSTVGQRRLKGVPTNMRLWPNVVLRLGQRRRRGPNIKPTLSCVGVLYLVIMYPNVKSIIHSEPGYWANVGSMLVHRLWRWPNIRPALAWRECTYQAINSQEKGTRPPLTQHWPNASYIHFSLEFRLSQCCSNAGPECKTLAQHCPVTR